MLDTSVHQHELESDFRPPSSKTNKEKLIKDLQHEIKYLKTESDLLKKDHKHQRQHIDQLERQLEKARAN